MTEPKTEQQTEIKPMSYPDAMKLKEQIQGNTYLLNEGIECTDVLSLIMGFESAISAFGQCMTLVEQISRTIKCLPSYCMPLDEGNQHIVRKSQELMNVQAELIIQRNSFIRLLDQVASQQTGETLLIDKSQLFINRVIGECQQIAKEAHSNSVERIRNAKHNKGKYDCAMQIIALFEKEPGEGKMSDLDRENLMIAFNEAAKQNQHLFYSMMNFASGSCTFQEALIVACVNLVEKLKAAETLNLTVTSSLAEKADEQNQA